VDLIETGPDIYKRLLAQYTSSTLPVPGTVSGG